MNNRKVRLPPEFVTHRPEPASFVHASDLEADHARRYFSAKHRRDAWLAGISFVALGLALLIGFALSAVGGY